MKPEDAQRDRKALEIFSRVVEMARADARAGYVEGACGGDAALKARVEALLAHHIEDSFLQQPAAGLGPGATAIMPLTEKPGDRIDRYKLLQKIGEGGMGVVYLAEQEEPVRRQVALKIIKLGMDTRSVVARFEAERQALAMMDHPNIAKVLDAGATETGRPYFVMELVRGVPITAYCDKNHLGTTARLGLFIQVCHAIQHAHQKGVIHRDIKPSNVMVTLHDGEPVPKVIDFGIAKATNQKLTEKTLFTNYATMVGTPAYMSPEQAEMSGLDIDTRTDVYALGVLLYELLTGTTPFDGKELLSKGYGEMQRIIAEVEPVRPSTRLSTMQNEERTVVAKNRGTEESALSRGFKGDLDWIVMKCLEKDRARRYETANGLAADLKRHLGNEPVVARPPSTAYRFQKLVRRNKLAFAAAGAVTAALVVGLGVAVWSLANERQTRQRAVAAENKARQVAGFLREMLDGISSVASGPDTKILREILDRTAERVSRDLKEQPDVEAELRTTIGQVYFALSSYEKAAEMHRAALMIRQKIFGNEHLDVASSLNNLGVASDYQKQYPEAETLLQEALALRRKLLSNEHPDLAASLHNLAHVFADQEKYAKAEPLYVEALALRQKLFGHEHLEVARSLAQLAFVRRRQSRWAEAERMQREALAMRRKLLGDEHPEVAHSLSHLAALLFDEDKLDEAETAQSEALAIHRKVLGYEHSSMRDSLERLGRILQRHGKLAEAEAMFGEALARARKLNDHPEVTYTLSKLAFVLQEQGRLAEARTALREAAEQGHPWPLAELAWWMATSEDPKYRDGTNAVIFAEKASKAEPKHPGIMNSLAAAYAEVGQFSRAVAVQKEAIALVQDPEHKKDFASQLKVYEANAPYRDLAFHANALAGSALRLLGEGKFTEAESPARECLAVSEKNMPDDWLIFQARSLVGGSLFGQQKHAEAEPLLLAGYEGMKQREVKIPPAGKLRLRETLQRLVQLYESTGRPAQAAEWKRKLEDSNRSVSK